MSGFGRVIFAGALFATALSASTVCVAYKGRVIDETTGKPAEGVYVIGRWETGGGFVVSSSGCMLAITKSDAKGEFTLVGGTGVLGKLFGPSSQPFVFFYKKGYIRTTKTPDESKPWTVGRDAGSTAERLAHVRKMQNWIDCGLQEVTDHKAELIPLYREMISEGLEIAMTDEERSHASELTYWLDVLEVGVPEADARARIRDRQQQHRK